MIDQIDDVDLRERAEEGIRIVDEGLEQHPEVAERIVDGMLRDMTSPAGGAPIHRKIDRLSGIQGEQWKNRKGMDHFG